MNQIEKNQLKQALMNKVSKFIFKFLLQKAINL
jgi:hypothetical protein